MDKNKIKQKLFFPLIFIVFLSLFGVLAFYSNNFGGTMVSEGFEKTGIVHVAVQRGEGSIYGEGYEDLGYFSNLVVDSGLNATRDILGQGTIFGAFDIIGLGNSSNSTSASPVVSSDTTLIAEYTSNGLTRTASTYATLSNSEGNWSIYNTFTSSGISGLATNKTCLFNQTTVAGSTMFACVTFTDVTLDGTAGDTLLINWTSFVTSG